MLFILLKLLILNSDKIDIKLFFILPHPPQKLKSPSTSSGQAPSTDSTSSRQVSSGQAAPAGKPNPAAYASGVSEQFSSLKIISVCLIFSEIYLSLIIIIIVLKFLNANLSIYDKIVSQYSFAFRYNQPK